MNPARRVLFMIRTKLGDTLTTYAGVRAFADANPDWQTTLLVRKDYAPLLQDEPGIRVIPFGGRADMAVRLLWERASRPSYDVVAVAWGQGPPVRWLARLVPARRRIHFQPRHADLYPESPAMPADPDLFDPGWQVARMVARDFPKPRVLRIPSLSRRYEMRSRKGEAIGIVPFADELRKNFDARSLELLLQRLRSRHPQARLIVFFNPRDRGAGVMREVTPPAGAEMYPFGDVTDLVEGYMGLTAWAGTDTGLYHLAVAMGIPATVFFGPTQPWKIVMPAQPRTTWIRAAVLGDAHCEVKSCTRPHCLHGAIAAFYGASGSSVLGETPQDCPMRAYPEEVPVRIRRGEPER